MRSPTAARAIPIEAATAADIDRFWAKVSQLTGCWEWIGSLTPAGYGSYWLDGSLYAAHRVAYEFAAGPIPAGLVIDHKCRNRKCVKPSHLEPVTMRENILRGIAPSALHATQTECVNGHPFDAENTRIIMRGHREVRACRACDRARHRQRVTCPHCGLELSRGHLLRHRRSARCAAEEGQP